MIHLFSKSAEQPFVEFNCAAVPESLLESELFGHEKGAFTHAVAQKKGLLEAANQGTLFLDEIGDLPLNLQAKLLTVLETRKFRRLGSTQEIETRFRLITATHRDLSTMIREGTFREDLYYRIQVVSLSLPSLRDTGRDVLAIASHFLNVYNYEFGKHVCGFEEAAEQRLLAYRWPGNVRELRNVIERAMIFSDHAMLSAEEIQPGPNITTGRLSTDTLILPEEGLAFESIEKDILQQALDRTGGNQSKAARLLEMSRDTFRYRLEKHGLL
jgi:transcriptional regulator with PAS, ATPase and Fis domain